MDPTRAQILVGLWAAGVGLMVFVLTVVFSVLKRARLSRHWLPGLLLSFLCFAALLPLRLVAVRLLSAQLSADARVMSVVAAVVALGVALVQGIYWIFVYHAGASLWEDLRPRPLPLLQRQGPVPWAGIGLGAAFGVAAGVVSLAAFAVLDVQPGQQLQEVQHFMAGADVRPGLHLMLPALVAVAVVEELTFRGVLLGALSRWWGGRGRGFWAAAALVSLVWASLHVMNTDAPLLKVGQIFVIGLFLAGFVRRWCLESAIAAHVGLNLASVLLGYAVLPGPHN